MNLRPYVLAAAAVVAPAALLGCPADGMTLAEAGQAMEEVAIESQASALTNGTIDLSTNFTIGQAVEHAAAELKTFVETQLPCAEVTLASNTLTVEYGAKEGNCTYKGQTYSGKHAITVSKDDEGEVVVDHVWTSMKNQKIEVNGTATVRWNLEDPSRRVVHDLSWTRLSDGKHGEGSGDIVQKPLEGGVIEGISIEGDRAWDGDADDGAQGWSLVVDKVEVRWVDPIPQAGSYYLTSPNGKEATLTFTRIDEDSIEAKLVTGRKEWVFVVHKSGAIEDNNTDS
ncbi:MAG: hypothetical protein R3B70_04150 [Polyangiaceae bacterium]